jgi:hypothetical protein
VKKLPTIKINIKTKFGRLEIAGNTPEEVLDTLVSINEGFIIDVDNKISEIIAIQSKDKLKDIVRVTNQGAIIVTQKEITHYEAIGLILYSMKNYQSSSRVIGERLIASGKDVSVAARIHEMRKRGLIFKPGKEPVYKLTSKGLKWLEDEVIPDLKSVE